MGIDKDIEIDIDTEMSIDKGIDMDKDRHRLEYLMSSFSFGST